MNTAERLLVLLGTQRELLMRLLELTREERACLLHSRLEQLATIVEEQSAALQEQADLSRRITQCLERSCPGSPRGAVTLTALLASLTEPEARRVRAYADEVAALSANIQREGRVNWHLAQQAMRYVDYTLQLIGRAKVGPLPYTALPHAGARPSVQMLVDSCA